MATVLARRLLSPLLALGLLALGLVVSAAPLESAATAISPAAAEDERRGNLDPDRLTVSCSQEDERRGNFDPNGAV